MTYTTLKDFGFWGFFPFLPLNHCVYSDTIATVRQVYYQHL